MNTDVSGERRKVIPDGGISEDPRNSLDQREEIACYPVGLEHKTHRETSE